jgi:hypothetical protein
LVLASDQELHGLELADEDLRGLTFAEDPNAQVIYSLVYGLGYS